MKGIYAGVLLVIGVNLVGGCQLGTRDVYARYNLGPAHDIVSASVNAMGGLAAWQKVSRVRASAIVTMYQDGAEPYITHQTQDIDLMDGTIVAHAALPQGPWEATVHADGRYSVSGSLVDSDRKDSVVKALAVLVNRLRGPLNIVLFDDHPVGAGPLRVPGMDENLIRVAVHSPRAKAYYFDAATSVLRLVTAGADRAGEKGTVTTYTYVVLPNGLAFPQRIRVVETGQFVLVGEKPLLEVEFTQVDVQ